MDCTWSDPQQNGFHVGFEKIKQNEIKDIIIIHELDKCFQGKKKSSEKTMWQRQARRKYAYSLQRLPQG